MSASFRDFDVQAYNARITLALAGDGKPANYQRVAKEARSAARGLKERDIQAAVLECLRVHPAVAWAQRFNTGAMEVDGRYVKFAFVGCSDILGQMKDGRFLAIECKRGREKATDEQAAFLGIVARNGGVAFVARSVKDVMDHLNQKG